MRTVLVFSLLAVLVIFSACSRSVDLTVKAKERLILSENTNVNKPPINADTPIVQKTDSSIIKSKYPIVFSGFVTLENREVNISGNGWALVNTDLRKQLEQRESPVVDDKTTIKIDVMNCAGYLGSGVARYNSGSGIYWKLQMISETMPTDILDKFKQCSDENDAAEPDSIIMRSAFAIESQENTRQNITIKPVDTRKLFASLPEETKKLLNNKYNAETRRQNKLSLANDLWTDINGDGDIDLVELSTDCGDFQCSLILYLVKGKWVKIGETQPA
jgi:hypothetical protein